MSADCGGCLRDTGLRVQLSIARKEMGCEERSGDVWMMLLKEEKWTRDEEKS
jgi:hypothetical protein